MITFHCTRGFFCDFHNSAESHLQVLSAKLHFGVHQSNLQTYCSWKIESASGRCTAISFQRFFSKKIRTDSRAFHQRWVWMYELKYHGNQRCCFVGYVTYDFGICAVFGTYFLTNLPVGQPVLFFRLPMDFFGCPPSKDLLPIKTQKMGLTDQTDYGVLVAFTVLLWQAYVPFQ